VRRFEVTCVGLHNLAIVQANLGDARHKALIAVVADGSRNDRGHARELEFIGEREFGLARFHIGEQAP
jgi:hypothetical protein